MPKLVACMFAALLIILPAATFGEEPVDFARQIAPLLATHCLECHHGVDAKGGLVLSNRDRARVGGETGEEAIVAGDPDASPLWLRVESDEMPPKHPLPADAKTLLKRWISEGAEWGGENIDPFAYTTTKRAGYDWWSLQPLAKVQLPEIEEDRIGFNDVDRFIVARLRQAKLSPSPPAEPRALIRRLAFDLTGLPPDPEDVDRFRADPSDQAYRELVEKYLSSPAYGERWGRHWLDVVRFGESDGFERNNPRRTAWPYRDWVIEALNEDMPYDRFVRMQLIGDLLEPNLEGAAATGFWTAGVHNTVVGGSERMKKLAREDEIEDVLSAVGQTFLGLTVNCGRCHDHKFDPVTQAEYYRMASAISGLGFGERTADNPQFAESLREIEEQIAKLDVRRTGLEKKAREAVLAAREQGRLPIPDAPQPQARWEFDGDLRDQIGDLHGRAVGDIAFDKGALVLNGRQHVVTAKLKTPLKAKTLSAWVQLNSLKQRGGAVMSVQTPGGGVFDAIVFGEQEPQRWMAGSNFFRRTQPFGGPVEAEAGGGPVHVALVYREDGTITAYRDGLQYGKPIRKAELQPFESNQSEILFGLRHDPPGPGKWLTGRIHQASLYSRALTSAEVAAAAGNLSQYVTEEELAAQLSSEEYAALKSSRQKLDQLRKQRDQLAARAKQKVYTLTARKGAVVKRLDRGDPDLAQETVRPGAVAAVQGLNADFPLPPDAPEADRRRALADWITNINNPLLDRVIVNRVWHYHFGAGVVSTPNDLGFNGGRPTHPELLDWLADWFRQKDRRLKPLHRLLVTSATYRQSAMPDDDALQVDADNRLLWRMTPRRLEAEVVRDAMLVVAGKLNRKLGGPSFEDVSVTPNNGTTYYEPKSEMDESFFRRTVYRFNPRGGRSALLDTFDCPDPAAATPRRAVTTTPLQALSLFNNRFVLAMSSHFADRVRRQAEAENADPVDLAWRLAVARPPTEQERKLSLSLVEQHGLESLCRGLFNVSEFVIAY